MRHDIRVCEQTAIKTYAFKVPVKCLERHSIHRGVDVSQGGTCEVAPAPLFK